MPLSVVVVAFGGLVLSIAAPTLDFLAFGGTVLSLFLVFNLVYLLILGTVGGWVGAYVATETDYE
ncbi:MAG: hypothetical protein J07HX5_01456 [halophilic archaeon J07HX5]|nr:MAG: hypothetical protein J07HX5_01456 [halophilic archaeon J07HX5]